MKKKLSDKIPTVKKSPEPLEHIQPILRFTPHSWAKLQWFCHRGETEIGGFGISDGEDLLCVRAFETVKQQTSAVTVAFDDEAVADLFDAQVDAGRSPEQFARIWLHSHPGDSPEPSGTDEETFSRVFGLCDWAVMFILANSGKTYARLRFNVGPKGELLIPVKVDYTLAFEASDDATWEEEYKNNIQAIPSPPEIRIDPDELAWSRLCNDETSGFGAFGEAEGMDLYELPEFLDEESEVNS